MPRLSLRAYEKKIEDLIDQNQLDEAVESCRHILRTYPKCISTYRILGKALLEAKNYPESADIFKRVLAVTPDDFIAHVGMSIVRENENNLDAAIWHMELAFDSQPSNITIQEELKRLFGKRDGTHPAKIRLTRGALVRMYARGELYPQAIAEIKSALSEDEKRLDLKVLLAKMYSLLGDSAEALSLANQLIVQLPYCYDINKILTELLPSTSSAEKTPVFLERLKELNPYEGFVNSKYPTAADVPDDQVGLDEMDYSGPASTGTPSVWINAMESSWEEPANLESVDWLPGSQPSSTNETNFQPVYPSIPAQNEPTSSQPTDESANANGEDLPAWMRAAGWLPSSDNGSTEQQNQESQIEAEPTPAEQTNEEELPDWLNSLGTLDSSTSAEESGSLASEKPVDQDQPVQSSETRQEENPEAHEEELPDWLKSFQVEGNSSSESTEDVPDWMRALEQNGSHPSAAPAFTLDENEPETNLSGTEPGVPISPSNPFDQPPNGVTRVFDEPESENGTPAENSEAPDAWQPNTSDQPENPSIQPDEESPEIPSWVHSVMDQTPSPSMPPQNDESPDDINPIPQNPSTTADQGPAISEEAGDDLLSWLREIKPIEEETPANDTGDLPQNIDESSPLDRLNDVTENQSFPDENQPVQNKTTPLVNEPEPSLDSNNQTEVQPDQDTIPEPPFVETRENEVEASNPAGNLVHIAKDTQISEVVGDSISELTMELTNNPNSYQLWQSLGDEYARSNDLQKALEAYNKAEELIIKSK